MKRAITALIFDFDKGDEFALDIHDPCTPLHAVVDYEPKRSLIERPNGRPAELVPIAKLYVEIDPDTPKRKRQYVALPERRVMEHPGELRYVAMFTHPVSNLRVAIYEVIERPTTGCVDCDDARDQPGAFMAAMRDARDAIAKSGIEVDAAAILGNRDVKPENVQGHVWRSPDASFCEVLEESGICDNCGRYASEAHLPCTEPVEVDGSCSPRALSGANDGGGAA
jgi:hypothetical protein